MKVLLGPGFEGEAAGNYVKVFSIPHLAGGGLSIHMWRQKIACPL